MTQLSGEELWAQACIQQELPGLPVEQHDDGSKPSMYDLQITYPDGSIGAVEVTAAADAQQLELWKVVGGRGKRWIEPGLAGGWQVRILPSTRGKKLLSQLPTLLRDLEHTGIRLLRGDNSSSDRRSALAGELGIVHLKQGPTAHPGSIYVMPPDKPLEEMGGFSPVNGDPLAKWLSEWIVESSREDNLRKLADSGSWRASSVRAPSRLQPSTVRGKRPPHGAFGALACHSSQPSCGGNPYLDDEHVGLWERLPLGAGRKLDTVCESGATGRLKR